MAPRVCLMLAGVVHPGGELLGGAMYGVATFLEILAAHGYEIVLVSAQPVPVVRAWLLAQGLDPLIASVVGSPLPGVPLIAPLAVRFTGSYPEAWQALQALAPYPNLTAPGPSDSTAPARVGG